MSYASDTRVSSIERDLFFGRDMFIVVFNKLLFSCVLCSLGMSAEVDGSPDSSMLLLSL